MKAMSAQEWLDVNIEAQCNKMGGAWPESLMDAYARHYAAAMLEEAAQVMEATDCDKCPMPPSCRECAATKIRALKDSE